jgi:hypothetical protein
VEEEEEQRLGPAFTNPSLVPVYDWLEDGRTYAWLAESR